MPWSEPARDRAKQRRDERGRGRDGDAPPTTALVVGALAAAAADGASAMRGVLQAYGSSRAAAEAFFVSAAVVAGPLLVVAVVVGAALGTPRARARVRAARKLVEERAGGHAAVAAIAAIAATGIAATRAAIVARAIIGGMSAHLAATAVVVVAQVAAVVAAVGALVFARTAGPRVVALEARFPAVRAVTRGVGARVALAVTVAAALDALLPREYVLAPSCGVFGWLVYGAWARTPRRRGLAISASVAVRTKQLLRVRAFVVALGALTLSAPAALARLPGEARVVVVQRPPYGSLALAAMRRIVDHDGDGYSPLFGGGDCDDRDPRVHPGARDVPGNGIDENCSGADAVPYVSPAPLAWSPPAGFAPHPNIVLVLIDALRPDRLGFAGNPRPTSPEIDRFRATSTWFRRTYTSAPNTRFALASLFTGLDVGSIPQARQGTAFELLPEAETLAERLDRLGYDRVGFTVPYVLEHIKGMGQGFRVWTSPWPSAVDDEMAGHDAPLTTDAAIAYLDDEAAAPSTHRPFLLFTHYFCTHAPYVRHAEHDFGTGVVATYDSALAYCDAEVGRLLRAVDARSDPAHTVVVVMSDHGELLGERGMGQHGTSLLEPAVRTLLLARVPGASAAVRTVDVPVTLSDIAPTLLRLASPADGGAAAGVDARAWSLGPFLFGSATPPPSRPIFLYVDDKRSGVRVEQRGVVDDNLKFTRDLTTGAEELVDLAADPDETRSRGRTMAQMPEARDRLSTWVEAWDGETSRR